MIRQHVGSDEMQIELTEKVICTVRQRKKEFNCCICRFGKSFSLSDWGFCMAGFEETRNRIVVS